MSGSAEAQNVFPERHRERGAAALHQPRSDLGRSVVTALRAAGEINEPRLDLPSGPS